MMENKWMLRRRESLAFFKKDSFRKKSVKNIRYADMSNWMIWGVWCDSRLPEIWDVPAVSYVRV